jgi:hypothetical protein
MGRTMASPEAARDHEKTREQVYKIAGLFRRKLVETAFIWVLSDEDETVSATPKPSHQSAVYRDYQYSGGAIVDG